MKTTPVKGTRDTLPQEARRLDYVRSEILRVYRDAGFERVDTPILEDLNNLRGSEGGENLGLIYKVLKRGAKLDKALREGGDPADLGLRYDLTVPLARFYAQNRARLLSPFKVIQIGRAFRAEQPQQGRLREFNQCDIDILGDPGPNAETELIAVTAAALLALGLKNFTVRVSDRKLLDGLLESCGFEAGERPAVCVALDKLDKIGPGGVRAELAERGLGGARAEALLDALDASARDIGAADPRCGRPEAAGRLREILQASRTLAEGRYSVEFDLTLVRGQGYYTGPVFEIEAEGYAASVAGGGRYDRMIGKFCGEDIPAVGLSIGFERICAILPEAGLSVPGARPRAALLYGPEDDFAAVLARGRALRAQWGGAVYARPKKLGPFIDRLKEQGYDGICVTGRDEDVRRLAE
ncbi:MAG: histidine--tRNA ligase family protein [Oscillospiraceae bacterium]|nr:histidine--tRNA ligase family protein [Oscillospiraceae bacterium]